MVEWPLVHSVTTEMCTGFLTLASFGILVKFLSDGYMKHFFGKVRAFDKVATVSSRYSEPASYFALGAGILMTFVSMGTGTLSLSSYSMPKYPWLVYNKVLLTITSQTIFIGVFIVRTAHKYEIWMNRMTTWVYFLMTSVAFAFIALQNSVAGQMVRKGSIIDDLLVFLNIDERQGWYFPAWVSIALIVGVSAILAVTLLLSRRGREVQRQPASLA